MLPRTVCCGNDRPRNRIVDNRFTPCPDERPRAQPCRTRGAHSENEWRLVWRQRSIPAPATVRYFPEPTWSAEEFNDLSVGRALPGVVARGPDLCHADAALLYSLTAFSMPGAALARSCAFMTGVNVT